MVDCIHMFISAKLNWWGKSTQRYNHTKMRRPGEDTSAGDVCRQSFPKFKSADSHQSEIQAPTEGRREEVQAALPATRHWGGRLRWKVGAKCGAGTRDTRDSWTPRHLSPASETEQLPPVSTLTEKGRFILGKRNQDPSTVRGVNGTKYRSRKECPYAEQRIRFLRQFPESEHLGFHSQVETRTHLPWRD